jgi:hypothetical protein
MDWSKHCYRVGTHSVTCSDLPTPGSEDSDKFVISARKRIEPWLSAVFQAEHLNLVLGSGFTGAIGYLAGSGATDMSKVKFGTAYDDAIDVHADNSAKTMGRGAANIEDQFRSALAVLEGLNVLDRAKAEELKINMDTQLKAFLHSILETESGIKKGLSKEHRQQAGNALQSFLLSFASRATSRERLHIFTSNYDRLIEHGCDLAGLRIIDRFVGALNPIYRSSRVEVDVHYNPPGIRGEPRFMEGVALR